MIYYQDEWVTQYCSDALTMLRELEGESIDLLCTDPPYGIGFMGKDWDKALPDKKIWAECLRVLKPSAFAFVMSIPRADCLSRMIISLEDAGFLVNFTPIFWAMASGFPKAQNCAKVILKRFLQVSLQDVSHSPHKDEDSQSDSHCRFCGGLLQNGLVIFRDVSPLSGDALKCSRLSSPSVDIQVDTEHIYRVSFASVSFHHARRDLKHLASWWTIVSSVLQSKPSDWLPQFSADNWGLGDKFPLLPDYGQHGSILGNSNALCENEKCVQPKPGKSGMADGNTHKSTQSYLYYNRYCPDCQRQMSNEYSKLAGSYSGFQPKPAVEVIIVCMKPLSEKTFVDQALKNRKGITWLDDGRIPYDEDCGKEITNRVAPKSDGTKMGLFQENTKTRVPNPVGRFPANLLVSDDVLNDNKNHVVSKGQRYKNKGLFTFTETNPSNEHQDGYGDSGSFSRYFDLDKWADNKLMELKA